MNNESSELGRILERQRVSMSLTLMELARRSNVSSSHLGRIERGERFPSARILRKIAKPLGFEEEELFRLADYLSPVEGKKEIEESATGRLDPIVAKILAEEPVEVQRTVIGILTILKLIAKGTT